MKGRINKFSRIESFGKKKLLSHQIMIALLLGATSPIIAKPVTGVITHTEDAPVSNYGSYVWGGTDGNYYLDAVQIDEAGTPGDISDDTTISPSATISSVVVRTNSVAEPYCAIFAERDGAATVLKPSLECDFSNILKGNILNRGLLDVFSNDRNNIERIDFVFSSGVVAPNLAADLDSSGFLATEKSGNNPTVMAVIKTVDASGNPLTFGPLTKIWPNGTSGQSLQYGMVSNSATDYTLLTDKDVTIGQPESIGTTVESVGMALVTLTDLGVSANESIKGFSYFSQDVYDETESDNIKAGINLADHTTFPTNTSGAGDVGDADIYGGVGSYFSNVLSTTISAIDVGPTANSTPLLSGVTNQATGETVTVKEAGGATVCTTIVQSNGTWSCTPSNPLALGANNLTVETEVGVGVVASDAFIATIIAPNVDSDNDGINDNVDIDDDNDGIPDLVELATASNGGDTDGDGVADTLDLDSDNDGIYDSIEAGAASNNVNSIGRLADDTDSDNDGLADVVDTAPSTLNNPLDATSAQALTSLPVFNTDGDSKPDFQDVDSDNDGISDLIESGTNPSFDTNSDGDIDSPVDANGIPTATGFSPVTDPTNTDGDGVADYRDLDSDNDGLNDVVEAGGQDADENGIIDTPDLLVLSTDIPETGGSDDQLVVNNPSLPAAIDSNGDGQIDDATDLDNDGIPDVVDGNVTSGNFEDMPLLDSDSDGIPDRYDIDDDNDGIPDLAELLNDQNRDTDNDGVIDSLDLDSDNDGILDIEEADGTDTDKDGRVDNATDTDNDGLADVVDQEPSMANNPVDVTSALEVTMHPVPDTDGDTKPDFQDIDSDSDGMSDLFEGGTDPALDTDNDGDIDTPVNVDGIPTDGGELVVATPADTDGDGIPNYRDLDSDNDGLNDTIEAGTPDENGDGIKDDPSLVLASEVPDADSDGLLDPLEPNNPNLSLALDSDGDGVIDDASDDDKDGIPNVVDKSAGFGDGTDNEKLETAVTGFGGSMGTLGLMSMMLLLAFKRARKSKTIQRTFPLALATSIVVPALMAPSVSQAETKYFTSTKTTSKCGTNSDFHACNYVAGGLVMSHVDPEGEADGWSTSDDMSAGYNLIVGRHFKPRWFAELNYTDMGEAELSNNSTLITGTESISYKVPSLHVGYLLRDPSKSFNLYAKGGVSAIQNDASAERVPYEKQTTVQATFGFGAQWQAKDSGLFARLGADFHDRDAVSAGLMFGYKFGKTQKKVVVKKVERPAPVVKKPIVVAKPVAKKVVPKKVVQVKKPAPKAVKRVVKQPSFAGVLKGVNFHTNSAVLTPKAETILKGVAQQLKRWNGLRVILTGHTDSVGSEASNLSLSQRRANSVKTFLIKQGVRANRMGTAGKGETQPRATNNTKEGRAINRRVELRAI